MAGIFLIPRQSMFDMMAAVENVSGLPKFELGSIILTTCEKFQENGYVSVMLVHSTFVPLLTTSTSRAIVIVAAPQLPPDADVYVHENPPFAVRVAVDGSRLQFVTPAWVK
jgi:hypothetical protein